MTSGWNRWRKPLIDIGVITSLLIALSYLPPDTSLSDLEQNGVLRFCVPDKESELIRAADLDQPGYELSLMQAVAQDLGLRLQLVEVANMGRSFNPRDWQIGRGQCDVLGGGIADSQSNRGFLTLLSNGGQISLVWVGGKKTPIVRGTQVGVFLGSAGLNRVRLSSWMRAEGLIPKPIVTTEELSEWLQNGGQAIASSLTPLPEGVITHELPKAAAESTALSFGLWRGDVTFTRAFREALQLEIKRHQIAVKTGKATVK